MVGRERKLWETDRVSIDGKSSLDVLLAWVTKHGNYDRWRGGAKQDTTKEAMCQEIVGLLHSHRLVHRHTRDVCSKPNDLERSFREAVDWRSRTEEGILRERGEDGESDVRSQLLRLCKHFDTLAPIMLERASSQPHFTNEDASTDDDGSTSPADETASADTVGIEGVNVDVDVSADLDEDETATPLTPGTPAADTVAVVGTTSATPALFSPSRVVSVAAPRKGKADVLEMWKEMTAARASIEKNRLLLDNKRFEIEQRRSALEIDIQSVEAAKKKGLA